MINTTTGTMQAAQQLSVTLERHLSLHSPTRDSTPLPMLAFVMTALHYRIAHSCRSTRRFATTALQYSHCTLTRFSSSPTWHEINLAPNSTPSVLSVAAKLPSVNRIRMDDLPTAASPTITNLRMLQ